MTNQEELYNLIDKLFRKATILSQYYNAKYVSLRKDLSKEFLEKYTFEFGEI